MAKITKNKRSSQRAVTRGKIRKLQRAGLLSKKIDPDKPPSDFIKNKFHKYRSVLSGKKAAVQMSSAKKAGELRGRIGDGGEGKTVLIAREKGERFRVVDDVVKSVRNQYGQRIEKTIGERFSAPRPGDRIYYTIPRRRRGGKYLKRQTFASFDEMLYYLNHYEIDFADIEDYIELERTSVGSSEQKRLSGVITRERKRYEAKKAGGTKKRGRPRKRGTGSRHSRKR